MEILAIEFFCVWLNPCFGSSDLQIVSSLLWSYLIQVTNFYKVLFLRYHHHETLDATLMQSYVDITYSFESMASSLCHTKCNSLGQNKHFFSVRFLFFMCNIYTHTHTHWLHLGGGTLNNLMVRLQSWSFRECGVPLHCHYSQVLSDMEL